MSDLERWLSEQEAREHRVVRLEDALLADRCAPYFFYRLRYFMARTIIATVLHGIRIVLLLGAFAVDESLAFIFVAAATAVAADAWWGALEVMRSRVRHLQRIGARYRAPDEIAAWIRLAALLAAATVAASGALALVVTVATGSVGPILVMSVAVIVGAGLNLVTRAYHSGAYAVRRVFRPLPSLLAADGIGLAATVLLWPMLGTWAFAVAEIVALVAVTGLSLHYTTRTYRSLAFPVLADLLRRKAPLPSRRTLRATLAPALSFGLVGLQALVLLAVLYSADGASNAALVALLAALTPLIRAGFEWARLLYFDLARLDMTMLAGLRRRFERAVVGLAVVIGGLTWLTAIAVAVVLMGIHDVALAAALLPFFAARSLLAAAQVRAFTARAYRRLTLSGSGVIAGAAVVLLVVDGAGACVLGLSSVLVLAGVVLTSMPRARQGRDVLPGVTGWLEHLREIPSEVAIHRALFDRRDTARGVTAEDRRTAVWRRARLARRLARDVARLGGSATWTRSHELTWFVPLRSRGQASRFGPDHFGGLVTALPAPLIHPDGRRAALAFALELTTDGAPEADRLMDVFHERFPTGVAFDVSAPAPACLRALTSADRAAIVRAAVRAANGAAPSSQSLPYEVSASTADGVLRQVYLVPREVPVASRRAWRRHVEATNRRMAAMGWRPLAARDASSRIS